MATMNVQGSGTKLGPTQRKALEEQAAKLIPGLSDADLMSLVGVQDGGPTPSTFNDRTKRPGYHQFVDGKDVELGKVAGWAFKPANVVALGKLGKRPSDIVHCFSDSRAKGHVKTAADFIGAAAE